MCRAVQLLYSGPTVSQDLICAWVGFVFQETESEAEDDNLDNLERHLWEKALGSMRKVQVSPVLGRHVTLYILLGLHSVQFQNCLNVFEL